MILKPSEILPDNSAFSAEDDIYITWKNNGDSMVAYEVIVEDNFTGVQAYTSGKISSYSGKHKIPASSFQNGVIYRFKIKVYNIIDEYALSNYKVFSCFTKPIVTIPNDGFIRNQTATVSATYSQTEGLLLNAYKFILFNEYDKIIEESEYMYDGTLYYEFNYKLENEKIYKIECIVITTNGISGSSGKIALTAQYEAPTVYFNLQASYPYGQDYIQLDWSTVRIIGETSSVPTYVNNDTMIDLTNNSVYYDNGFILPTAFTIRFWIKNIQEYVNFLELNGLNGNISMNFYDNKIHVYRQVGDIKTHISTEELTILPDSIVYICLQQFDGKFMNIFSEVI